MTDPTKVLVEGSYTPINPDDENDIRVRIMAAYDIPKDRMAEAWQVAMRVQLAIQNSAREVTAKRDGGASITTDDQHAFLNALALGLGVGLRNIAVPASVFGHFVGLIARAANDSKEMLSDIAAANGHPIEPKTLN